MKLRRILGRIRIAALCLALCCPAAALAEGPRRSEASTEVKFKLAGLEVTATADCVVPVGDNQELRVTASGTEPLTYAWEVSANGTDFTPIAGATNASYTIMSAVANTPAQQPYTYRVTVTDGGGGIATAEVKVLVSNDYDNRTIELRDGDLEVTAYMHDQTRLVVTPLPDDVPVAETLETALTDDCVPLLICDVSLVNQNGSVVPYFGALLIRFQVGTEYNGQTLKAHHLHNGSIRTYSGVVAAGILPIVVEELSPFMIEVPDSSAHTITAGAGAHGSIAPAGNVTVPDGGDKTFVFQPNVGYAIDAVEVDGNPVAVAGNSYTFTDVAADRTIQVSYRAVAQNPAVIHTVTVQSGSNGTVTPAGTQSVTEGAPLTLTIAPDTDYELDELQINGTPVRVSGRTYTIPAVESNLTIYATFRAASVQPPAAATAYRTITATAEAHGSISPAGDVTVEYGGGMYFHFQGDDGYEVDRVFIDGTAETVARQSYQFIGVTGNRTIRVTFKPSAEPPPTYYTITSTWGENGRISPGDAVNVPAGGSQTFYMIPNSGYVVEGVWIDGVRQSGAISQYTFTNVTAVHTIRASFRRTATPPTGDADQKLLWAGLIAVLTLLLFLCLFYIRKLKRPDEPHDQE